MYLQATYGDIGRQMAMNNGYAMMNLMAHVGHLGCGANSGTCGSRRVVQTSVPVCVCCCALLPFRLYRVVLNWTAVGRVLLLLDKLRDLLSNEETLGDIWKHWAALGRRGQCV